MMSKAIRHSLIAAAVGAVTLVGAKQASAQYRVETGHSNDASNRAGSGGYNAPSDSRVGQGRFTGVTGNDVVTGNVTGGKQFRGNVPYTEDRAFRGNISRPSDAFIRGSSGTPYGGFGGSNSNASTVRPFYGDARAVAPPDGFVRNNVGSGGYVPGAVQQRSGADLRLGSLLETPTIVLPSPGQTVMPGPVDPSTNNNTLITASSLYGVRQWNSGVASDQQFVSRYANAFGESMNNAPLSDLEVGAMRREMQQAAGATGRIDNGDALSGQKAIDSNPNESGTAKPGTPASPDANIAKPLPTSFDAPNNSALPSGQLQSRVSNDALAAGLNTGESIQSRVLVPAAQQSTTNDMLQQRLEQAYGKKQPTDVDAARQYNKDMAAKAAAAAAQKAGQNGAGQNNDGQNGAGQNGAGQSGASTGDQTGSGAGGGMTAGGTPKSAPGTTGMPGPTNLSADRKAPPQVKNFSEGFKAKGPAEILKKADDLMKDGKWFSAIQQFDSAQQVAPNNMLVVVGRATAELGGSYYGRAEADLRTAFTQDPAMLEGQYDLRTMIGDDRLQFLVKDLKDIAGKSPTKAQPVFLLAYIAYNSGNERMAAGYLDLAEKRAGAGDTFYGLVRQHWTLPKGENAPTDLNLNK